MRSSDAFIFESVRLDRDSRRVEMRYSFDDAIPFTEYVEFPAGFPLDSADSPAVERALFALHLIGGVSYYKALLPRRLEVRSGTLTPHQAAFWDTVYTKGLGEFFYRNDLDFRGLVNFPAEAHQAESPATSASRSSWQNRLVPWGGGKDSVVTLELLREAGHDPTLFRLGRHHFIDELAERAGLPLLTLERRLDPRLFELNAEGAWNGHVPITTYMSFLTVLVCLLGGYDSVFFSSERSADFGNIDYLGMRVNHQWSKSQEAETLIRGYLAEYVTEAVDYVNPLRPLSELSIARIFAGYPQYFDAVTSCNTNWRILDADPHRPPWCGTCPKCAFVFTILSAFLPAERLVAMFGRNLYADQALLPLFRELWGGEGFKPFECVGTPDVVRAALYLAGRDPAYAQTPVLRAATAEVLAILGDPQQLVDAVFAPDWTGVPAEVRALLGKRFGRADS